MTSSEVDSASMRLLGPMGLGCGKTLGWMRAVLQICEVQGGRWDSDNILGQCVMWTSDLERSFPGIVFYCFPKASFGGGSCAAF